MTAASRVRFDVSRILEIWKCRRNSFRHEGHEEIISLGKAAEAQPLEPLERVFRL
jgi:hypothetical protein